MTAPTSEAARAAAPSFSRVIEPGSSSSTYWVDLLRYRDLLFFLAWRDIVVQYKQTVFGLVWALARPMAPLLVFTLVFGKLASLPSGNVPYPLLVLAGLLPWQLFSASLGDIGNSLVGNGNLISKVYFPRLIVPLSAIARSLVDFSISVALMITLMLWFGLVPGIRVLAIPLFLLLTLVLAFGCGVWISALNIRYRDFRYMVPLALQLGLFLSPIGFSSAVVPERWRALYSLNPMVGVIDGFRWALLGDSGPPLYWPALVVSIAFALLVLVGGLAYFRRTERRFADLI